MISPGICAKCDRCKGVNPSKNTDCGDMILPLSVDCELGGLLLQKSDLPKNCPMKMEQMICEEDAIEVADLDIKIAEARNEPVDVGF